MPELPEVEIVRRGLERVTLNQPIQSAEVLLPRVVASPARPANWKARLTGCQFTAWHRRGKYLLADLRTSAGEDGGQLGVHLRMTGQLLWLDRQTPVTAHTRFRLFFDDSRELRFVDQRTFGRTWWVPPQRPAEAVITGLALLGPEPFDPDFSVPYLSHALRRSQRPIKNALLDQALVAGIGNIYADEALFLAGIRPTTRSKRLTRARVAKLHAAIRSVLQTSIEAGGTTFSDYRDIYGVNGQYSGVAWVYGRTGQPCRRCGTPIRRLKMGGRSAHFCPHCQH